jgi:hypothetical protein
MQNPLRSCPGCGKTGDSSSTWLHADILLRDQGDDSVLFRGWRCSLDCLLDSIGLYGRMATEWA